MPHHALMQRDAAGEEQREQHRIDGARARRAFADRERWRSSEQESRITP
jgi:hypothetical protein